MKITNHQFEKHLPLHTTRLLIRKVSTEDAEELFKAYASDPEVTATASWVTHTTIQETKDFIKYCLKKWDNSEEFNMCLCLKDNPFQLIGMFKVKITDDAVNIGYVLAKKYWNQGFMTEAVKAVCQFLFSFTDILEIQAFTDPENIASIAVMKKAGFTYSHKLLKNIVRPQLSLEPRDSVVFRLLK